MVITFSMRTPASTCCTLSRLLSMRKRAADEDEGGPRPSPTTMRRRNRSPGPDDPRAPWFRASDQPADEVCREGSKSHQQARPGVP
jgi:hypothetical protein